MLGHGLVGQPVKSKKVPVRSQTGPPQLSLTVTMNGISPWGQMTMQKLDTAIESQNGSGQAASESDAPSTPTVSSTTARVAINR